MENIDLESERLILTRVSLKHVTTEYLNWINDPEVHRYIETKGNYTMDLLKAYVEQRLKDGVYFWAIHLKGSKRHIGNIKIDPILLETNSGEYSILMGDKTNWGKGYAKEASLRILKYGFEELGLSKITLGVIQDNINAFKLYEKLGFTVDEVKKNVGEYNNRSSNALRMSLHVENFK